jgi:hypothetical protein
LPNSGKKRWVRPMEVTMRATPITPTCSNSSSSSSSDTLQLAVLLKIKICADLC